jgi:hypothetical protein
MKQPKTYHKVQIRDGKEYHSTQLTDTGKAEKEIDEAIVLIKKTKYNPVAADLFKRECKIGKYREWVYDMKRLEEINNSVLAGEATMHPSIKGRTKTAGRKAGGTNITIGKKQRERLEEQLIHELNNG